MADDEEQKVRAERARLIGLFRYQLIREPADPAHSTKARGRLVRALAAREHTDPFGRPVRVARQTLNRRIRDWRARGVRPPGAHPPPAPARTPARGPGAGAGRRAGGRPPPA